MQILIVAKMVHTKKTSRKVRTEPGDVPVATVADPQRRIWSCRAPGCFRIYRHRQGLSRHMRMHHRGSYSAVSTVSARMVTVTIVSNLMLGQAVDLHKGCYTVVHLN